MASAPPNRRLAAVLFADVAGYSRLMERDETGTHKRVGMVFAEVIEPAIARHAGRFVSKAGDGVLAEFLSSTAALQCAIEVQRQAEERTRSVPPRDQIRFRIGINVADILVDENDIVAPQEVLQWAIRCHHHDVWGQRCQRDSGGDPNANRHSDIVFIDAFC